MEKGKTLGEHFCNQVKHMLNCNNMFEGTLNVKHGGRCIMLGGYFAANGTGALKKANEKGELSQNSSGKAISQQTASSLHLGNDLKHSGLQFCHYLRSG